MKRGRNVVVDVFGSIRKCCEDNHLLIVGVDGMLKLILQIIHQHPQLAVMLGSYILQHDKQQANDLVVGHQITLP